MGGFIPCTVPRFATEAANELLNSDDEASEVPDRETQVHMVICGIDYSCDRQSWAGQNPLDTKFAFDEMVKLSQACEVDSVHTLWNQQCTKDAVREAIEEQAGKCETGDYLIFYYTGHGDQLPQDDFTEGEAHDQCLCLVDEYGNTDDASMTYRHQVWMRDDDLADAILDHVDPTVQVIVIVDACHSGSICDFGPNSEWTRKAHLAVSMSGCEDTQTSAGTGRGGYFSRALFRAVEGLTREHGGASYSLGRVYNRAIREYESRKSAGHTQNITIHGCGKRPQEITWPLKPERHYQAPQ
eukprot:TRINITY_DN18695_c0_g1_i1.p1 TRINITY_DN18695_c0_g1~~TRINITY_DN18695_c0_g1_i1.p1  ORF type:complete len:298 (-),score=39.33 TRINITY_DN18695_c0_g1_i1:306-1199(-)